VHPRDQCGLLGDEDDNNDNHHRRDCEHKQADGGDDRSDVVVVEPTTAVTTYTPAATRVHTGVSGVSKEHPDIRIVVHRGVEGEGDECPQVRGCPVGLGVGEHVSDVVAGVVVAVGDVDEGDVGGEGVVGLQHKIRGKGRRPREGLRKRLVGDRPVVIGDDRTAAKVDLEVQCEARGVGTHCGPIGHLDQLRQLVGVDGALSVHVVLDEALRVHIEFPEEESSVVKDGGDSSALNSVGQGQIVDIISLEDLRWEDLGGVGSVDGVAVGVDLHDGGGVEADPRGGRLSIEYWHYVCRRAILYRRGDLRCEKGGVASKDS